jgi:hypothetical protein
MPKLSAGVRETLTRLARSDDPWLACQCAAALRRTDR